MRDVARSPLSLPIVYRADDASGATGLLLLAELPTLAALGRAFVLAQAAAVVTLTALEASALRDA